MSSSKAVDGNVTDVADASDAAAVFGAAAAIGSNGRGVAGAAAPQPSLGAVDPQRRRQNQKEMKTKIK